MNKHAYLIMAHGNWKILQKLLFLLDDIRNDIYLHIDAKTAIPEEYQCMLKYSKLITIEAISVYWADFSQVEVTLRLLAAAKREKYSYYHLISGVDLPIKSNKEIYEFFEKSGREFIGIVPKQVYYSVRRVKYYHPFVRNQRYRISKILKGLDRLLEYGQRLIGINRLKGCKLKIIDGWQWFSITHSFCCYILENENRIRTMFSNTIASDELFMQTLAYNSEFYHTLYDTTDLKNGSMRFIDWKRGKPYIWGQEQGDFEILMSSPYMFARKFDEQYFEIVERICNELDGRNQNEK
jgi:hypothetical protein